MRKSGYSTKLMNLAVISEAFLNQRNSSECASSCILRANFMGSNKYLNWEWSLICAIYHKLVVRQTFLFSQHFCISLVCISSSKTGHFICWWWLPQSLYLLFYQVKESPSTVAFQQRLDVFLKKSACSNSFGSSFTDLTDSQVRRFSRKWYFQQVWISTMIDNSNNNFKVPISSTAGAYRYQLWRIALQIHLPRNIITRYHFYVARN